MLVEKSTQKLWKSTYRCDRCGVITEKKGRIGLYIQRNTETPRKYVDLCVSCFKSLERGIKKGAKDAKNKTQRISEKISN